MSPASLNGEGKEREREREGNCEEGGHIYKSWWMRWGGVGGGRGSTERVGGCVCWRGEGNGGAAAFIDRLRR